VTDLVAIAIGATIGVGTAQLAHSTDAYYHDAVRPLGRDLRADATSRPQVARYAWGVSWRFVFFFATPFSILTGAVVSHLLFLPAEVLAIRALRRVAALVAGALVGAAAVALAIFSHDALGASGLDIQQHLHQLVDPVLWLYPAVPALAAMKLPAPARGTIITALAGILAASVAALADHDAAVGPAATAASALVLVALHLARAPTVEPPRVAASGDHHIRRGFPVLLVVGAGVAALAATSQLAGDPMAAVLISDGHLADAVAVALLIYLSMFSLVSVSTVASDSYSTQGTPDLVPAVGYVLAGIGWLAAAAAGAAAMAAEVAARHGSMSLVMRRPIVSELASAIRDALGDVMLLALLVGGLALSGAIGGAVGFLVAGGAWLLNEQVGRPVTRLAVTPIAALAVGVGAELWRLVT
jgi:hypothetical protein